MKEASSSYSDPLIDEVRERRRELLARYDNDLSKLCERIQQAQSEHLDRVDDRRKFPIRAKSG